MKAIGINEYGGAEQLTELDLPTPEPGPGELRIKVHAVGMNPVDFKTRAGKGFAMSARDGQEASPFPRVLGYDVSGTVDAVGEGVRQYGQGSEVYVSPRIDRQGGNAEYVIAHTSTVSPKPSSLSHEQAAGLPLAVLTAWMVLYDRCDIQPKQTVLINGGGGGVGHIAIQLAKLAQCRVLATASRDESIGLCKACGADQVINYREVDVAEAVQKATKGVGCHAVLDCVGGQGITDLLDCIAPGGQFATITPVPDDVATSPLFTSDASLHQVFMPACVVYDAGPEHHSSILRQAAGLVDEGLIKPHVTQCKPFNLENLRDAHEQQAAGHVHGKIVLTM